MWISTRLRSSGSSPARKRSEQTVFSSTAPSDWPWAACVACTARTSSLTELQRRCGAGALGSEQMQQGSKAGQHSLRLETDSGRGHHGQLHQSSRYHVGQVLICDALAASRLLVGAACGKGHTRTRLRCRRCAGGSGQGRGGVHCTAPTVIQQDKGSRACWAWQLRAHAAAVPHCRCRRRPLADTRSAAGPPAGPPAAACTQETTGRR